MTAAAPLITCTPGIRSGKPCISGTRISVGDVLEYLASGMSQEDILADFPYPFRGWDANQDRLRCRGFDLFPGDFTSTKKPPGGCQGPTLTIAGAA